MKTRMVVALLVAVVTLPGAVVAKEKKPTGPLAPIGWVDLHAGSRDFSTSETDWQKGTRHLPQGELLPVLKMKEKSGVTLGMVGAINLQTGFMELGWVKMDPAELKPPETYPRDSELLRQLGGPYLDDLTAEKTAIARFLVRQAQGPPVLLCYVLTAQLFMAKLVIFTPDQRNYVMGEALEILMKDLQPGINSLEIRDLVGDGNECVIAKENFRELEETSGSNLVIRRIADGKFQIVWQAPLKFKNLSQFNSKIQILQPPEKNIGAPGTITTGEVAFRSRGKGQEPVWSGKVEFFLIGREKAYDFVKVEKACPWDGREFAPLR
jgi:hypothetical protein